MAMNEILFILPADNKYRIYLHDENQYLKNKIEISIKNNWII